MCVCVGQAVYIESKTLLTLVSVQILEHSCNREFKQFFNKMCVRNMYVCMCACVCCVCVWDGCVTAYAYICVPLCLCVYVCYC